MPWCVIIGCNNNIKATKQHEKDVSYHIFPKNPQRRNAWMNSIKRPFKFNADTSYVCSNHFMSDDFECNSLKEQLLNIKVKRQLKRTAIPSINMPYDSEEGFANEANNSNTGLNYINQSDEQKYCAVPLCNNSTVNCGSNEPNGNSEILFHTFPKDTVILQQWLRFCNIYKSISNEYQKAQICSVHFNKDDYGNKYTKESLHPIKVLKKNAVPTLNGGIKIVDLKSIEDELSKKERKQLVDKLLADYEEQQKNEKGHLNGMVTKYPGFFSPKINPNAKLGDKLKLLKSMDNPITYPPSKRMKTCTTPKLNTENSESSFINKLTPKLNTENSESSFINKLTPKSNTENSESSFINKLTPKLNTENSESSFINKLTQKLNQLIQVTSVKGGHMLHALPHTANNVLSPHLEKTVTDEEEEIIIVTGDEASHLDLSSYEEEDKGNNTEVIIVTDSEETEDSLEHIKSEPNMCFTNKVYDIDKKGHVQKLLKNNESLFTPLNKAKVSSSNDKGCQVIIPCNGCENRSLKINKLLRERTKLLQDLNQSSAWKDPDEVNTLMHMVGVLSLLLMQSVGEKNGKKSTTVRVDAMQDSIERVKQGWSMQDSSDVLCQALSINAYDEFARAFEMINEL